MDEELHTLKSRTFFSVASLFANSTYSAALGFAAFFILTLKSGVGLLGIYASVLAVMSFFNYFTDLGLGAALIQKKDVDETDLSTAFFIQFFLVTVAVVVGYLFTPTLLKHYPSLPRDAVRLYWSLLISFFLLSLKSIPSIILEKKLKIYKVVFVQVLENTVFYACVIIFSLMGYQITSLVIAVLVRSVVGLAGIYILNPWVPQPLFSLKEAYKLLRFGIPYQGNSFLALVKDDLLTIYLGGRLGLTNLGYISFAKKYAEFSIRFVMDNINRVAFPLFSKLQTDRTLLKKSLEKVLLYQSVLIFPIIIGAIFVFENLLKVIPGYFHKWSPVLFSFYFFSLSSLFVSMSTPFINLFNATGKIKYTLMFMVLWIVLIWSLVLFFVQQMGINGVSVGFFVMSLSFIFVVVVASSIVRFSFVSSFGPAAISTSVMSVFLITDRFVLFRLYPNIYIHLIVSVFGAVGFYAITLYMMKGRLILRELHQLMTRAYVKK